MTNTRLPKRYQSEISEQRRLDRWRQARIYDFSPDRDSPVFSIDTPPATVSGRLHLGHVFSYSHTDFIARFRRMRGHNVFYPMGFDDNGLPTERLVERLAGVRAGDIEQSTFVQRCLQVSEEAVAEYRALWQRLGLSIDWRYTYRTIDKLAQQTSQLSFLELYQKGLAYRQEAPTIWCPECHTAIAQAELDDLDRESVFYTLAFQLEDGGVAEIGTTRPEMLPACVAIFVHPDDKRFQHLVGKRARVPYFGQTVPILKDSQADPEKGSGIVMCCTFGDSTDVAWWYIHELPLRVVVDRQGRMTELAGAFNGLTVPEARRQILAVLNAQGALLEQRPIEQSVRVHERCDTPVEYAVTYQWFIRVLDFKEELQEAGAKINWHPEHMQGRYREWVRNLDWDWCISRQRYYGVPFPVWYCQDCGDVMPAQETELPVDPRQGGPSRPCRCGSSSSEPDADVMDTWATSSLSPQIVGQWLTDSDLYEKVFPFSMRAQAHEIIRTWAFYTIAKSQFHFGALPWENAAISGWALAPAGSGKISKSRGGGPTTPLEMIERYGADGVRYWAASTGPGKDAIISEEKIKMGQKLVIKLWNVARFSQRFLPERGAIMSDPEHLPLLSPADRWILAGTQRLIRRATDLFEQYDYAAAKNETEIFFWRDLADNYLEMVKVRLYGVRAEEREGAQYTLYHVLLRIIKLFAPFMPFVTDEIYETLFSGSEGAKSIHISRWPEPDPRFEDSASAALGEILIAIATAVRRYKSENSLALGTEIARLQIVTDDDGLAAQLWAAAGDIGSITRAQQIIVGSAFGDGLEIIPSDDAVGIALCLA